MTETTANKRYVLQDVLGQGGMGTVYRAYDRLTRHVVALKRIALMGDKPQDTPSSDFRVAISNEFRVLASLRHPNIIQVLDFGIDANQPYFTMEMLNAPQTILEAAQGASLPVRIRLIVELLQALTYLHRRGILHRDLKPANVLVDQSGTVKVLDFGLSLMTMHSLSNIKQNTAGTLAYMAPELYSEDPATVRSDLYSVGVIACELLAGHHPFNQKNVATLLYSVLSNPPDLSGADKSLASILRRLLEKKPEARIADSQETIRLLCVAADQPLPVETSAIRESFLQAARFVGRDEELRSLRAALRQTVFLSVEEQGEITGQRFGKGSAWLVGGESGAGKSRLFEELQIRAMVYGALVIHGQAITEGSMPYHVWREPLRRLVLTVDITDEEASILQAVVPDINHLLERAIPPAPAVDPQATQARLLTVITDVFHRVQQPLVVILEDLQWAAEENLVLLNRLITLVDEMPLLLLGNYRNDESPHLPEALKGAQLITLQRFDEVSIAELSEAMLGANGQQAEVINFLQQETEGNVFFLIEMARALAEQAGRLDLISQGGLASTLIPKGIQDIVQRRLNRVSPEARPLLQLAAVAGRDLDLNVCASFTPLYSALNGGMAQWLSICADAAVIEIQEQRWRFSHDRLREALQAEIPSHSLPALHQQLGETLERLYADIPEQIPAMAHHFQQAGDHTRAVGYLKRGGQIASAAYANDNAISLYRTAVDEYSKLSDVEQRLPDCRNAYIDLQECLGDILELTGSHDAARQAYLTATPYLNESTVIAPARLSRKTGKTWENQRAYAEALQSYLRSIEILEHAAGERGADWWFEWLECQMRHLMIYYWMSRPQDMERVGQTIQSSIETHGSPVQRGAFFLVMSAMEMQRNRYSPSEKILAYLNAALAAEPFWRETVEDLNWRFMAGFNFLWCGDLESAERMLQGSTAALERMGEVTILSRNLAYLALIYRKRGQIDRVRYYAQRTIDVAAQGQMLEYIGSAKGHQAWVAIREGDFIQAKFLAEEGCRTLPPGNIQTVLGWIVYWPLIAAEVQAGLLAEAIEHVKMLLQPAQQSQPEDIQDVLRAAGMAWQNGNVEMTHQHLMTAVELARPWGYV